MLTAMSFFTVMLTALALAMPMLVETLRTTRAFEDALVERHLLERRPGAFAPGTSRRNMVRARWWDWRTRGVLDADATVDSNQRIRTIGRLRRELRDDAEIGPLARRSRQWPLLLVVSWLPLLPVAVGIVAILDPLTGRFVPIPALVRVPLVVVAAWVTWFVIRDQKRVRAPHS